MTSNKGEDKIVPLTQNQINNFGPQQLIDFMLSNIVISKFGDVLTGNFIINTNNIY